MTDRKTPLILVVDDEPDIRRILRTFLEGVRYEVAEASNGESGLKAALTLRPDVLILDERLPDFDGHEVHQELTRLGLSIPTVLISAMPHAVRAGRTYGIFHFLQKPIVRAEVLWVVKVLVNKTT